LGNDDYAIPDAFVKYTSPDEKLTVNVWSKNLTDEEVLGAAFAVSTGRAVGGTWLPPGTYGVTVGYNF
jgi:iron complex outermembrane receptor protein